MMFHLLSIILALTFLSWTTLAVIAPSGTLSTILPRATDAAFGNFISDGGAGGYIQKWNQSLFSISDGSVCDTAALDSKCEIETHTAYATIDGNDPTKLTIIGNYNKSNSKPNFWPEIISYMPKYDVDCTNGACFAPAPHVAPIPIPGNDTGLLNVWPVHPNEGAYVYNTMFEMNFFANSDYLNNPFAQNVPAQRIYPVMFNISKGEAGYGSAALTSGRGSEANTHFYLWEGDSTGWKLARAPWATRTDKTTFTYWHGAAAGWVKNAPLRYNSDSFGNVANVTGTTGLGVFGQDIRWVDRFQTYVITFMGYLGYTQQMMYSLTGEITGPYSTPRTLFDTTLDTACKLPNNKDGIQLVDFIQTHWDYYGLDASRTLVSWISCTRFQNMAIFEWTNGISS